MDRSADSSCRAARRDRLWKEVGRDRIPLLRASYRQQRFPRHRQDTWVIGTNLRGRASCFGQTSLEVEPGVLAVIPPGVAHGGERTGDGPWEYVAAYPSQEVLLELQRELTGRETPTIGFSRLVYADPALARAFAFAHAAGIRDADPLAAESMLLSVLARLLERYGGGRQPRLRPGAPAPPIESSLEYIEDHLSDPLSLGDIAAASGYTRFHFLRLFKASTGETPHAYLMRRRVECVQAQLRRGHSIADAAYDCGFSDQAHLTRRFRQLVGVTPGEFVRGALPVAESGV